MKLPVNEFLVKIAILLALVGVSTYREVATVYPHATLGYYLGNVIPWLLGVAVVGSIVGLLVWAVVVLLSDAKNKDIGRALVLGGIYLLTIWAIWAQEDAIQQFKDSTGLGGKIFDSIFGVYLVGLSLAIPGVDKILEAYSQQVAQRPGINRWLLVGASSLLVFIIALLMSDNILMSGEIGGGFAILYGLVMFLSDALVGRLRFWKIAFPRLVRGKTRRSKTIDWGAMSLALINSKNWHGLLLLTDDWLTAERGSHESWASKGLAHEMLGDADKAISAYQMALKIRYDETVAKRIDALVEGRVRQNHAREEQERKKAEDKHAREQRTRHSSSKSGYTGSGHSSNGTQFEGYYRILEIQPGVTINEVKAAYKRQVQQYHPDKVASLGKELRDLAEAKSKEINEAYRAIMAALST